MLRSTGTNCAAPRLSAAGRGRGADAGGRAHLQIDLAAQHHGRAEPFVHPHLQLDELEQELGDGAREEQPRLAVHPDAALLVEVVQDAAHAGLGGRHEVDLHTEVRKVQAQYGYQKYALHPPALN